MNANLKSYMLTFVAVAVLITILIIYFTVTRPSQNKQTEVVPTVAIPTQTQIIIPTAIIPSTNVGEDGL
jgi:hypothetical protein